MGREHWIGRSAVRDALLVLSASPSISDPARASIRPARARRLRAPLLLALAALLALETLGGWVLFVARLAWGTLPGETLHVAGGLALTGVYAIYQWKHWKRVAPIRRRLDYAIGLLAASSLALVNLTGLWLVVPWASARFGSAEVGPAVYPPLLSAAHNIASMLAVTFAAGHLAAVLLRDRTAERSAR